MGRFYSVAIDGFIGKVEGRLMIRDGERTGRQVFRIRGELSALSDADRQVLFDRSTSADEGVRLTVAAIIDLVRRDGDAALVGLAREYDGVTALKIEVPRDRWESAERGLDAHLRSALEHAADNIRRAHQAWVPTGGVVETEAGVLVQRRPDPLDRVGVYAPGGRAAYPSSVLMGAIPARVAGVREVILCSPPGRDGWPSNVVLAAASLAGVDRVFAIGGAGAIAAMAYGTATVPRVDRVVGPGNAYVAEAKIQVAGAIAIDTPAGPSELLVLGDSSADPEFVAREVVAQAEHDPHAAIVVVILGDGSAQQADRVLTAVAQQAGSTPRHAIVSQALSQNGALLTAVTVDDAIAFANDWSAEHLLLVVADPEPIVPRLRGAGTICVGPTSSVVFGDYMSGANHVLPTGGLARSYGGLSTLDFIRWTTIQRVSPAAAAHMASDSMVLAEAEHLPGHAAAALGAAQYTLRGEG
jgi:histidinol dehydrogenase